MYAVSANPIPSLDESTLSSCPPPSSSVLSSPFLSSHLHLTGDDMSPLDSFHWYDQLNGLPEPELEFNLPPAAPAVVVPAPTTVPVPASSVINTTSSNTLPVFSSSSISAARQAQPQERSLNINIREQYESLLSILMKKNSRCPSDKPTQAAGYDQSIFNKSCDFPVFYSPFHVFTPSTPEVSSFTAPTVPQDLVQEDEQQQSLPMGELFDTSNDLPSGATSPGSSTHDSSESLSFFIDGIDTGCHAAVGALEPEFSDICLELDSTSTSTSAVSSPQQHLISLATTVDEPSPFPSPCLSASPSSLPQPSALSAAPSPAKLPSSRSEIKKAAVPYNSRLHTCSVCNKLIRGSKANLTRHMLIHKGQLPFECPYCPKRFRQTSNLEVHMKAHTLVDAPYQCSLCGVRYKFLSSLHRHQGEHNKNPEKFSASC